jgi:murein DD-endopeptidase MepM/ murein hydrolase activator NlpD
MTRASLAAAFAASLILSSVSPVTAADDAAIEQARMAEECLLGSADDEARVEAYQLFTREIAVEGTVAESFDAAIAGARIDAATMLEARQAFAAQLDLARDVRPGDRFYVRYEQAFTAEGVPVEVGRVMWAELKTKAKGTIAIHRFRTRHHAERLWLANGQAATPPSMRLPLDVISMSSGFGLRADPFDQPRPLAATGKSAPMGGPKRSTGLPPGLPTGGVSGSGSAGGFPPQIGAVPIYLMPNGNWQSSMRAGAAKTGGGAGAGASTQSLFMHEGVDLVAPSGTPVYAAADGVVIGAAPNGRYGNWIRIEHGGKLATVYGHLMAFAPGIEPGETVVRGELIGFVGSTGRSTGAHLHFELQVDGKPVNPVTNPEIKPAPLRGADLERFRKQVTRSLEERERESKVAASIGL